ncbi:alpha/beta hydrolase [Pseudodesulfovibrio sp. zrk46]|uniref:alpha/beta fold hydrolase n=1 Tax=Pseudodesulfovibrio sp. zrk46 TaxID=2725288 RepID=UPI001FFCF45B|nr:alpha/beta hydrolase [Pseudodesulfovibrio sp. zrk46]
MSSEFWRRQIPLAATHQIITMDLRGHGRSQSVMRGLSLPRNARDIHDIIRALGLDNVTLIGWSMGGAIAMDYWKQFGNERLAGIGFIETAPAPMSSEAWNTHRCRAHNIDAMNDDMDFLENNQQIYGAQFVHTMFLSGEAPPHAHQWMLSEHLKTSPHTARTVFEDYMSRDYTHMLPTITLPTLVMYGRSKNMCYGPSTGRFVAGSIPGSQLVILERSGHLPFYEEADLFNHELTNFITQLA